MTNPCSEQLQRQLWTFWIEVELWLLVLLQLAQPVIPSQPLRLSTSSSGRDVPVRWERFLWGHLLFQVMLKIDPVNFAHREGSKLTALLGLIFGKKNFLGSIFLSPNPPSNNSPPRFCAKKIRRPLSIIPARGYPHTFSHTLNTLKF